MNEDILSEYVENGFNSMIPKKVFYHFLVFLKHGVFCRYPRYPLLYDLSESFPRLKRWFAPYNYTGNLWRFKAPLCVIAGDADHLAHQDDVIYAYHNVGTPDTRKRMVLLKGYGHLDLNLGVNAKKDVYPKVHGWIKEETSHS
ncbi:MAG: hypothetical protein ACXQS2_03690 [Methermicoccaceae archaeon]